MTLDTLRRPEVVEDMMSQLADADPFTPAASLRRSAAHGARGRG